MSCSNCFNGCGDIISDQCVRYTGIDIPGLDIHNGDNLLTVENKITEKILTLMDGSGIIPKIDPSDVCDLVKSFLPCCGPYDLNTVLTALLRAICALDARMLAVEAKLTALNADYVIGCLTGVTTSSDTHEIVQAIITKLCEVEQELITTQTDLATNYVLKDDLDDLIEAYLASQPTANKYYTRMIPWVAIPIFFIPPGAFDSNGVGIAATEWEKIYICNGTSHANIPDLRGRDIVGSTAMGPAPYDAAINPTFPGNPAWAIGEKNGANTVVLTQGQLAAHAHGTTVTINDPTHSHQMLNYAYNRAQVEDINETDGHIVEFQTQNTQPALTGLKGTGAGQNVFVAVESAGGGEGHPNIQPGIGAYYIMYIP